MKQPEYSPLEALERIKLMMKYDMSKTLNENKEVIKQPINEFIAPIVAAIGTFLPWFVTSAGAATISTAGAVTTTGLGLTAVGTWLYNVQGGGDAFSKTQTFLQGCTSLDKNLKPTQSKGDHRAAADGIYNAIQGIGTDEAAIKGSISSMETVADLCAMAKYYNRTYGDLYDDLDSDLDGESFRQYVWSAIAPMVDDAEEDLAKVKQEGDTKKTGGTKYKSCSGTYTQGCYSEVIKQVQGCLGGLVTDGKFGPKTNEKLKSAGFSSGFSDNDVDKICNKPDEIEQVDAEDSTDLLN